MFSFLFSALVFAILWLSIPGKWLFWISGPLYHVAMHLKFIIIKSYAFRMFPVDVRGLIISNYSIAQQLCMFLLIFLFDWSLDFGKAYPFFVAAVIDLLVFLIVIPLSICGLIGKLEPKQDQINEAARQ